MLDSDDNLKILLCNFEYTKLFETDEKGTRFFGIPEFLAHEMINNVPDTNSVDIWLINFTFYDANWSVLFQAQRCLHFMKLHE